MWTGKNTNFLKRTQKKEGEKPLNSRWMRPQKNSGNTISSSRAENVLSITLFTFSNLRTALETIQEVLKTIEGLPHITEILGVDDESNMTFIGDFQC